MTASKTSGGTTRPGPTRPGPTRLGSARIVALLLAAAVFALPGCSTVKHIFKKDKKEVVRGDRVSVLELEQKIVADPRIADLPVQLPQPTENEAWPNPGGLATHAMYHLSAGEKLKRDWRSSGGTKADENTRIMAPPIIVDGKLFVLDAAAHVTAMNAESGHRLWRKKLVPKKAKGGDGFGGGVAFDNGRVFVATGFGHVYALDPETGKQIWDHPVGVPFHASPTAAGGRVYIVSHDNELHVLSQDDGRELWNQQAITEQAGLLSSASPAVSGEIAVVPYSSGELYAYRAESGSTAWFDSLTRASRLTAMSSINDIAGSPVIDRDRVYAVSHEGRLAAIDLRTGERIWTRDVSSIQTPWVAGDYIYLVTKEAQLLCVSAKNGQIRWITQLRRFVSEKRKSRKEIVVWTGPVLAGEKLILASSIGRAVMVSPYDGKVLGQIKLSDPASVPPVVAKGTVYFLTDDAKVTAYR